MISNRIFSFHLGYSSLGLDLGAEEEESFALFGGYDPEFFEGSLVTFQITTPNIWSLTIRTIAYANEILETYRDPSSAASRFLQSSAFAIIDTGTTMLGIPDTLFEKVRKKWLENLSEDDKFRCDEEAVKEQGFC